jgi:putative protein kinase ArgK-like GTPase of G3E family
MAEEPKADENAAKLTMGDLKKLIAEMIPTAPAVTSETPKVVGETPVRSVGIAETVKAEIEKLKVKEAEESEKQTIQEKLQELSERTTEKQPIERRRVHKLMGWGENG